MLEKWGHCTSIECVCVSVCVRDGQKKRHIGRRKIQVRLAFIFCYCQWRAGMNKQQEDGEKADGEC